MNLTMPPVKYAAWELKGGWDQITPTLSIDPGALREVQNFEVAIGGGYTRIAGYERYDGHAKPSDATYSIVQVTSFTNTPSTGQTLTGFTSGATGTIIAVGTDYVALTKTTGSFTVPETVQVGLTVIGTTTTSTTSLTSLQNAQYLNLAADVYRALISAPPGSGPIRGVMGLSVGGTDNVYAFRDNAGGTAVNLWRASASGWTQVNMKNEVSFTTGSVTTPADGATLTQGGVTATVRRVMASSGTWAGGTAAGRLVIDNPAGGNFAAGAATLSGGATVVLTGAQTAITITPGGKVEAVQANFAGSASTIRLYGVDGVNRAFEFDGTTYAPIATGASTDTPKHIAAHHNYLFLSIASSLLYCGVGTPYRYTATDGGGEIAVGDTIVGMLVQPGAQTTGSMVIYGRSNTFVLYGLSASSWNLTTFNTGTGGIDYTAQNLAQPYVLDDRGVNTLSTSIAYGNFTQATLTHGIRTFINNVRSRANCSSVVREKSQYRLYFNDGSGLYLTIVNGKMMGSAQVVFPTPISCTWSGELSGGTEVQYLGGADGMVYQTDVGSSFDGANIDAYITLPWNAMRSPRVLKRFRKASVEMKSNYYAAISFGYQVGYGTTEIDQPTATTYSSSFSGTPQWDLLVWDNFIWDGVTISPTEVGLEGTAENIQITISSTSDYLMPFTINSVIVHYTPRRGLR